MWLLVIVSSLLDEGANTRAWKRWEGIFFFFFFCETLPLEMTFREVVCGGGWSREFSEAAVAKHRRRHRLLYGAWMKVRKEMEEGLQLSVPGSLAAFFETPACTHAFHIAANYGRLGAGLEGESVDGVEGYFVSFFGFAGTQDLSFVLHVQRGGKYVVLMRVGGPLRTREEYDERCFFAAPTIEDFMHRMMADQWIFFRFLSVEGTQPVSVCMCVCVYVFFLLCVCVCVQMGIDFLCLVYSRWRQGL
jgi:hypothetical protein